MKADPFGTLWWDSANTRVAARVVACGGSRPGTGTHEGDGSPRSSGKLLGLRTMQPSTLAPEGRVPAHNWFDCRLDPSSPGFDILVRNSQHVLTQQVLHRGRFAATTRYLFVLSTCPPTLAHLFGSASAGEPGCCPARIPLPDESGSPLREILWGAAGAGLLLGAIWFARGR
jgi:hypothetical protein